MSPSISADIVLMSRKQRLARFVQRGMTTAEYAVGILAAVTLALVLLRIFNDNAFFESLMKLVLDLLNQVSAMIPS